MADEPAPARERPTLSWPAEQPTIVGARIVLRPWELQDADHILAACQDPLIGRFTRIPQPYGHSDALAFVEGSAQQWRDRAAVAYAGVDPHDEDTVWVSVGLVRVDATDLATEIGYWTAPAHRRHGHAAAATELLSRTALAQWGFARVSLVADVANRASQGVAVASGFRSEGVARRSLWLAGQHRDAIVFSRVRSDL